MRLAIRIKHIYPYWVLSSFKLAIQEIQKMASALEDIRREVSEAKAGMESARVMLVALRDRLDQMVDESANYRELSEAVAGLANELSDSTDALSAAVEEPGSDEVPADPVEPEEPEVPEEPSDEAP